MIFHYAKYCKCDDCQSLNHWRWGVYLDGHPIGRTMFDVKFLKGVGRISEWSGL